MTCESLVPPARVALPAARHLSPTAAFYLQASITVSFLAGSSAPTPLYATYQAMWGFTPMTTTVIFGIYALAVLAALLVFGRLSDHVGRRPVLLSALAVQVATMIFFAHAGSVSDLIFARIVQGLSAGAAIAAVGAGLLDLDKTRGAIANAVAPPVGTGLGALAAGLMAQYLPQPTHFVYYAIAFVMVAQAIGVLVMRETHIPRAGAWSSLKPQLRLSHDVRGAMLAAIPALVATWALAGFYASLGPALIRGMLGGGSTLLGGVALFVMATTAALATLALRERTPREMTIAGAAALLAGVSAATALLAFHSLSAFLLAIAISGAGFGLAFQGAIRSVAAKAAAHERASVLSVAFVVAYLAMGVPAVIAGYFVTRYGNMIATARGLGFVVMALAAISLIATVRNVRRPSIALSFPRRWVE
jgi:MFS family permease